MSCYFRQLKDLFDAAGIEVTSANRRQVDEALHRIAGVPDKGLKGCPATWKKLKTDLLADETKRRELAAKLKRELG